jgi:hypothetical protein
MKKKKKTENGKMLILGKNTELFFCGKIGIAL